MRRAGLTHPDRPVARRSDARYQGPTIALWGARNPSQLDPIGNVEGRHIDPATKAEIDAILLQEDEHHTGS
jgi:hypothetical protein